MSHRGVRRRISMKCSLVLTKHLFPPILEDQYCPTECDCKLPTTVQPSTRSLSLKQPIEDDLREHQPRSPLLPDKFLPLGKHPTVKYRIWCVLLTLTHWLKLLEHSPLLLLPLTLSPTTGSTALLTVLFPAFAWKDKDLHKWQDLHK